MTSTNMIPAAVVDDDDEEDGTNDESSCCWSQWEDAVTADGGDDEDVGCVGDDRATAASSAAAASSSAFPLPSDQQQQHQPHSPPCPFLFESLPLSLSSTSQLLHPAVSLGMYRVSSCYFSLADESAASHGNSSLGGAPNNSNSNSVADLLSLWCEQDAAPTSSSRRGGEQEDGGGACCAAVPTPRLEIGTEAMATSLVVPGEDDQYDGDDDNEPTGRCYCCSEWLYQDILVHVFAFLDSDSLRAFSETSRRSNFECFHYFQLQLQRALVGIPPPSSSQPEPSPPPSSTTPGIGYLARLAQLDRREADETVREFLDSNATLRRMPLSHSLAYVRDVLRSRLPSSSSSSSSSSNNAMTSSQAAAAATSAAVLITLLGAASLVGSDAPILAMMEELSSSELSQALLKVGVVGSLMGAAKSMSESERADRFSVTRFVNAAYGAYQDRMAASSSSSSPSAGGDGQESAGGGENDVPSVPELSKKRPRHSKCGDFKVSVSEEVSGDLSAAATCIGPDVPAKKLPSGCVGAYERAIRRASSRVREIIKRSRKVKFESFSPERKRQVSSAFIDACCSDDTLDVVKESIGYIDAEGFYVGTDGTETCALHAAAFHGSCRVLEFLCRDIDGAEPSWGYSARSQYQDGGLCNVNAKDANGWTAVHFAAGANSIEAVKILASHGADLSVEAANGYTPLQWALRLQHHEVAEELQKRYNQADHPGWITRQPLSVIASRFLALIPSH